MATGTVPTVATRGYVGFVKAIGGLEYQGEPIVCIFARSLRGLHEKTDRSLLEMVVYIASAGPFVVPLADEITKMQNIVYRTEAPRGGAGGAVSVKLPDTDQKIIILRPHEGVRSLARKICLGGCAALGTGFVVKAIVIKDEYSLAEGVIFLALAYKLYSNDRKLKMLGDA